MPSCDSDSSTDTDGVIDGSPLAAWLKSVPDRSTVELSDARRTLIDGLITDLESARFRLPPGVEAADILAWTAGSPPSISFQRSASTDSSSRRSSAAIYSPDSRKRTERADRFSSLDRLHSQR